MQHYHKIKEKQTKRNLFIAFLIIITIILVASLIRLYNRIDVSNIAKDGKFT